MNLPAERPAKTVYVILYIKVYWILITATGLMEGYTRGYFRSRLFTKSCSLQ